MPSAALKKRAFDNAPSKYNSAKAKGASGYGAPTPPSERPPQLNTQPCAYACHRILKCIHSRASALAALA